MVHVTPKVPNIVSKRSALGFRLRFSIESLLLMMRRRGEKLTNGGSTIQHKNKQTAFVLA